MPGRVGCIAPTKSGGFIAAMEHEIIELTDDFEILRHLCRAESADPSWRFNDGKCDRSGAFFWVGSIYLPRDKRAAGVWRLSRDGAFDLVIENITTANGIAWSPDGSAMYVADSWHSTIWAYDYDGATGNISNRRIFYQTSAQQGRPDGAAVDDKGYYWFAAFGAGRVVCLTPGGRLDQEILVPVTCPTMVAFGGPDLRTVFVTSSSDDAVGPLFDHLDPAGGVLSFRSESKGIEEALF